MIRRIASVMVAALLLGAAGAPARAADTAFQQFLHALWAEAQQRGVSRAANAGNAPFRDLQGIGSSGFFPACNCMSTAARSAAVPA